MDSYAISDNYDYIEVSLDSEDFSGTNTGTFTPQNWPLFEIGGARTLVDVVGLKIISAEIPFSYYIVNTLNNVFTFTGDVTVATPITITPGNYNSSQMTTELKTQLDAIAGNADVFTVTYSTSTNRFTIVSDGATNASFTLTFGTLGDSTNTDLHWFLGFNSGDNASTGTTLVTPNVINLSGPNYLYINSQKWGQLTNFLLPQGAENLGGGNRGPQTAKVPVNVGPGEIIFYDDPDPEYWFNVGFIDTLQAIDFYLTLGNFKEVIDLQGLSFCLKLGVLKKKAAVDTSSQGGVQNNRVIHRSTRR